MEPKSGALEDDFPFQLNVYILIAGFFLSTVACSKLVGSFKEQC